MNKIFQLLFIALILVVVWFHKGLILGGGEAGIIFYDFSNELGIVSNSWVDKALGNPAGVVTAWHPYFTVFSFLQKLGIPPVFLQASLFYLLLSIGFIGMYLLIKQTAKNNNIAFIASLFYNLNLFALTVVWNRFQYPYMFFYASLPLVLYLFRKGLYEGKILYAFLLGLLSVCFSTAFSSVPLLLLFWLILGSYWLYFLLENFRSKRKIIWSTLFFFSSLILFIFCNFWWLLQLVQTILSVPYLTNQPFTSSDNYLTFDVLSERLGFIDFLMRFMHKDFFVWMSDVWGGIYFTVPFVLFSFLPAFFVFGSLFIKKKPQDYFFFLSLVLFGIFFAKGNADPFGGIFNFLFTHISILEVFRNPFEKIGLILPLGYAPLFAYGAYYFYRYLHTKQYKLSKTFIVSVLIITCGLLVWPMWNGWVFTSNEPPTNNTKIGDYVRVPRYYEQANNWLNVQKGDYRTIALPLKGEGLTYQWEYGYNGVDPTSSLFTKPFLSFCTGVPYLCSLTNEFQEQLIKNPETFWKILPPLYAKNIMIREDVDYKLRSLLDPQDLHHALQDASSRFSSESKFEKLTFYSLNEDMLTPKIVSATKGIFYSTPHGKSFVNAAPYADYQLGDIYMTDTGLNKQTYQLSHAKQVLLQAQPFEAQPLDISSESAELELPFVRFLPDSKFYLYTRAKERITRFLAGNNSSRQLVVESDKRIVEIAQLVRNKRFSTAEKMVSEYVEYLTLFTRVPSLVNDKGSKSDLLRQKYVLAHILSELSSNKVDNSSYLQVEDALDSLLNKLMIQPHYPVDLSDFASYQITVPEEGVYNVLLETDNWSKYYKPSTLTAIIDGKETKNFEIIGEEKTHVLFSHNFSKGNHQIDIKIPEAINIIAPEKQSYELATNSYKYLDFPFKQFDQFGTYNVSFDYFLNKGDIAKAYIIQNADTTSKDRNSKSLALIKDKYDYDWKQVSDTFTADSISHNARLQFQLNALNDCLEKNQGFLQGRCDNAAFKSAYNMESKVTVKNLSITRRMNNNLFLVKDRKEIPLVPPTITYEKQTATNYLVKVRNAKNPYFLTFLESYDPRWKAYVVARDGTRREIREEKHVLVNSFANSWYMEDTGDYDVEIEFLPEELLTIGKRISLYTILLSGVAIIILFMKGKSVNNR